MNTQTVERQARRLRTHTVVYADRVDILCASLALQGRTTKSIAVELGLTQSKAQYRIAKAQKTLATRFRDDYRNGKGPFAAYVRQVTQHRARQIVRQQIAPQFTPLAANRAA